VAIGGVAGMLAAGTTAAAGARVLTVGTYRGNPGRYTSIQQAVNAAHQGDWILVGPGDYHERNDLKNPPKAGSDIPPSGVLVKTPDLHIRGMSRNRTIVDGTKADASKPCSDAKKFQDFGASQGGSALGRNGIVVWKTDGVTIQNLTTCNFLAGSASSGNEIWWNGGDGSGKLGLGKYRGAYLNTTSTFFDPKNPDTAAQYGMFTSNSNGPGVLNHTYASNFNDSNYYIGACRKLCNQKIDNSWSEYSALGYSGTNAGGRLVVKNSEFDNNKDGFDTNSQNNDDWPSPQNGHCAKKGKVSPITHTESCWAFIHNYVHDNNNPNVPAAGAAALGPVGTGMTITGGRFDTIMDNRIVHNGAWGVLFIPYPDNETPPPGQHCQGGSPTLFPGFSCTYDDWANQLFDNKFSKNGFFGNPTNSDFGEITLSNGNPINCYQGNQAPDGSSPPTLQQTNGKCGQTGTADPNPELTQEVLCNTQLLGDGPCLPTDNYPRLTKVVMHKLPKKQLPSMPNPCSNVPPNTWCPAGKAGRG
jgi:hypothetical protein